MLGLIEDDKLNLEEQTGELDAQNRKMRRQIQEISEDLKDRDVEIEELKFRINSESSATTEFKTTIGDLERELKVSKEAIKVTGDQLQEKSEEADSLREKERKTRLQLEEMDQRVQEMAMSHKEAEQYYKSQGVEIERLRQETKNQKANLRDAEDQVKRAEETVERLKKIKQEKDVAIGDMEEATREQVQELRRQIEDRQKDIQGLKAKIGTMENEVEHEGQRRAEQLNKILELENEKRLYTQSRAQARHFGNLLTSVDILHHLII